jgi:proliferating cell nuclear antigen
MKFELSNPSILKTVIESLSVIVDECGIRFTQDQVNINALSKDHTTFLTVTLDKYLFDEYAADDGELIIVDMVELSKIMKRCKNTDHIVCTIDESNLHLTFQGDSSRTFTIRLIDNDYESPMPPIIDYPVNLDIPTKVFNDTLGDLKIFTDVIQVSVDNDYIIFKGDGQSGDGFIKYLHGEHIQNYYKSQYSITKLSEIMKAKDFSETITIGLGDDLPLNLTFKLVTGDGKLEFLLAPRIEND